MTRETAEDPPRGGPQAPPAASTEAPHDLAVVGGFVVGASKRLKTETGELELEIPRDREGSFDPVLVPKGQQRLPGFDEKVIALCARGMTTREIQGHLKEIFRVEVSPSLISAVTDAVLDDVKAWQARPLDAVYPIVYLDAIHVKMRTGGPSATSFRMLMSTA